MQISRASLISFAARAQIVLNVLWYCVLAQPGGTNKGSNREGRFPQAWSEPSSLVTSNDLKVFDVSLSDAWFLGRLRSVGMLS